MTMGLLYWILMLLWLVLGLWWHWPSWQNWGPPNIILFILLLILGWHVFGAPIRG